MNKTQTLAIALALLMPTVALAEQRQTYRDANGREVGRSVSNGRNTVFRDTMGREIGRSVTDARGNTTFYDAAGRRTGSTTRVNGSR